MRAIACLALLLATAAAQPAPDRAARTTVSDPAALARLRRNGGITLQWISWDYRGRLRVGEAGGRVHLNGSQRARGGAGLLTPAATACATAPTNSGSPAAAAIGGCRKWSSATGSRIMWTSIFDTRPWSRRLIANRWAT